MSIIIFGFRYRHARPRESPKARKAYDQMQKELFAQPGVREVGAENAQLDFLIEEMNKAPHGALVLYVQQTAFHSSVNNNVSTGTIIECS